MTIAETQSTAAELEKVGEVLRLYAKALTGHEIRLMPRAGANSRGAGWVTPTEDGKAISLMLPSKIDRFPSPKENFAWYKVILTHQSGHAEFGTFQFALSRPSKLFQDWRPGLIQKSPETLSDDRQGLRQLFPDPLLGMTIFDCVEDARIDAQMLARYPGVAPAYHRVAHQVLAERPRLAALPLREALVEGLVQAGLGGAPLDHAPERLQTPLASALEQLRKVKHAAATVEDTAEAALRVYQIAAQLPNVVDEGECCHDHDHDHRPHRDDDSKPDRLDDSVKDPDEARFKAPPEVEFRMQMDDALLNRNDQEVDERNQPPLELIENELNGPLLRDEPFCYLYPEWDFRAGGFKDRWCRVRERVMEEGTSDFYTETLSEHRLLVNQVRSRFEHFMPELFRKVTRRYDGEDVDLDRLVDLVVDTQAGVTPSEKIYWRRERTQRDVAVALLLDMSATTNEYVLLEAARAMRPTAPTAQSYSQYLRQIAAGIDERGKPLRRRTIDIEKQAAIVLIQALESIGDNYAVYAFSGSGRGSVEFHVVKDFAEPLSQRIARRMDGIAPAHATRMGAAIRHAVTKLERVEAQTRLLFLVSDGRPYDRDYGRDANDQEYAVHDTRQALREAARRKVRPFCLTVDKEGADYMRAMCEDLPYEVVGRVEDLPISLITAYPKLTA
jgi:nitric oxide reductase activation protein